MEIIRCEMAIFLEDVAVVLERYGSTEGRVKWAHPCTSPSRRGKACSMLGGGSPSSALKVRPASVFTLPRATIKSLPTSLDAMPSTNLLLAARKGNDHERIIVRSRRLTTAAPQALRQLQQQRRAGVGNAAIRDSRPRDGSANGHVSSTKRRIPAGHQTTTFAPQISVSSSSTPAARRRARCCCWRRRVRRRIRRPPCTVALRYRNGAVESRPSEQMSNDRRLKSTAAVSPPSREQTVVVQSCSSSSPLRLLAGRGRSHCRQRGRPRTLQHVSAMCSAVNCWHTAAASQLSTITSARPSLLRCKAEGRADHTHAS